MQNRGLAVNPDAAEMCADILRDEHPQLFAAMLASGIFDRKSGSPLVRKARGGRARDLYSIHPRFEALSSVERVTSSPDVQYLPRSGGVRECFVPRSGFVFAAASYSMFELHSAAVALRYVGITGSLGRALSEGVDPNVRLAASLLEVSYDEAVRRAEGGDTELEHALRLAEAANCAFPLGMCPSRFIDHAIARFRISVTESEARKVQSVWQQTWPEFREYFSWVENVCSVPCPSIRLPGSQRWRGNVSYMSACTAFLQGVAANAVNATGFLIANACYADTRSPLFGCHMVNSANAQFLVEAPEEQAPEAAEELARLMVDGATPFFKGVSLVAAPLLMGRWSAKAKAIRDEHGRLVPWDLQAAPPSWLSYATAPVAGGVDP